MSELIEFPRNGGKVSFKYSFKDGCDKNVTVTATTKNDWIHLKKNDDVVSISVDAVSPNDTDGKTGEVKFIVNDVPCDNNIITINEEKSGCNCLNDSPLHVQENSITLDAEISGEYTFTEYDFDTFCVNGIKGISFKSSDDNEWITNVNINSELKTITGNVTDNSERKNRNGVITLSGDMKTNLDCNVTLNVSQNAMSCDCENLIKQIKQVNHFMPPYAVSNVYIGSGNTNDCGLIEFIDACIPMDIYKVDNPENPNIYEVYASSTDPQEGTIFPQACGFNIKITLKDGTIVDNCPNSAIWLAQIENYCDCNDFEFNVPTPTQDDKYTYDEETKTFRFNIDRNDYGKSGIIYVNHVNENSNYDCTHKFYEYYNTNDEKNDSKWYYFSTRYDSINNRDVISISIYENGYKETRMSNFTFSYRINGGNYFGNEYFDGDECETYNFEIIQEGVGDCCNYDFRLDENNITINASETSLYYEISDYFSSNYPTICLYSGTRIKIYDYYEDYYKDGCNELKEEYLLAEYLVTCDETFSKNVDVIKEEETTWIKFDSDSYYCGKQFRFITDKYSGNQDRKAIVAFSLDECENTCDLGIVTQEAIVACDCETLNLAFDYEHTEKYAESTVGACTTSSSKYIWYDKTYCSLDIFKFETYKDSELTELDDQTWLTINGIGDDGYLRYNITYNGTEETRCTYIKIMHKDDENCYITLKVCQTPMDCDTFKNSIVCNSSHISYYETSATIASIGKNCGDITAEVLNTWSGTSSYSDDDKIDNWITDISHTFGLYTNSVSAEFSENETSYVRNATFKVCSTTDGSCCKECTIRQYNYESLTCECGYMDLVFTPEYNQEGENIVIPTFEFDKDIKIGTITLNYYDCNYYYYCSMNVNYSQIHYRLEYNSSSNKIDVYFNISKSENESADEKVTNGTAAAFTLYQYISQSEDGIENHLKECTKGCCVLDGDNQCKSRIINFLLQELINN